MEASPHILVVEDDREMCGLIARLLKKHGFRVSTAAEGRAAGQILEAGRIDLILLDIMLPGEDGLSLCRRIRAGSTVPIIMLTALGEDTDRIVGLEMGADDYLPKPFNPRELVARVRAALRRAQGLPTAHPGSAASILSFAGWRLDRSKRQLNAPGGERVELTSGEFDLLVAFCEHPQRVLSRDQLLDLTQGRAAAAFDRSIDIHVSRLRRKIEADPRTPSLIKTVRSSGYFFTPEVASLCGVS